MNMNVDEKQVVLVRPSSDPTNRDDVSVDVDDVLEALIDKLTIGNVLLRLAKIAALKEEHIKTNWPGDERLILMWRAAASRMGALAMILVRWGM